MSNDPLIKFMGWEIGRLEGRAAFDAGAQHTDNPHEAGKTFAWQSGWNERATEHPSKQER